jgi:hypothetical protein
MRKRFLAVNGIRIRSKAVPIGRGRKWFSTARSLGLVAGVVLVSTLAGPGQGAWAAEPPKPGPAESSTATPASGIAPLSAGRGYIDGDDGTPTDDWRDEGTVRPNGSYWFSNVAGLWQTVLWADGLLNQNLIDCRFGNITSAATRAWQRTYLAGTPNSDTGAADPNTWGRADDFIVPDPVLGGEYFRYLGTGGRYILFHRYGGGILNPYRYDVNFFGEWRGTWYNSVSISFC